MGQRLRQDSILGESNQCLAREKRPPLPVWKQAPRATYSAPPFGGLAGAGGGGFRVRRCIASIKLARSRSVARINWCISLALARLRPAAPRSACCPTEIRSAARV